MTWAAVLAPVLVVGTFAGLFALGMATGVGGGLLGLTPAVSCSVTVHTENGADDAIQTAINTYPGGTICIGAGTFPEQLTITNSNTILKGAGASKTIIEPNTPLVLNTVDYDSNGAATPAAAIILVEGNSGTPTSGVTGVTIEDLQVNGLSGQNSFSSCSDNYFGVDFQASSGTLTSAAVNDIALPTLDYGCQDGLAVYAYNGWFNYAGSNYEPDTVTISHTTLSGYDKNGITCDDPDETCVVSSDTVTGIGPTPLIADNGIQIAFGALGTVSANTVDANGVYTGNNGCSGSDQSAYDVCSDNEGAGILLYDAATGSTVSSNSLSLNEYGIDSFADGNTSLGYSGPVSTTISHNTVDSSVAYGIVAEGAPGSADSATITSNTINNKESLNSMVWGAPGILVDTGSFTVSDNTIEGTSVASGASNGASQTVCGPTDFSSCTSGPTTQSLPTAAIQAASENISNVTYLYLGSNSYSDNAYKFATLGVDGGSVDAVEVE